MSKGNHRRIDLRQALINPGSVFETPEEVLDHPDLSRQQKIDVLRRWEDDAIELAVAEEEGMVGGEPVMLARILGALNSLENLEVNHSAPKKQKGV